MIVHLPAPTAVLEKNDDLCLNENAEDDKIIIEFDTRERDHHKIFKLKRVVKIRWINERAVEAQEFSASLGRSFIGSQLTTAIISISKVNESTIGYGGPKALSCACLPILS